MERSMGSGVVGEVVEAPGRSSKKGGVFSDTLERFPTPLGQAGIRGP